MVNLAVYPKKACFMLISQNNQHLHHLTIQIYYFFFKKDVDNFGDRAQTCKYGVGVQYPLNTFSFNLSSAVYN